MHTLETLQQNKAQIAILKEKLSNLESAPEITQAEIGRKGLLAQEFVQSYPFFKMTNGASGYKDTGTITGLWGLNLTYVKGTAPKILVGRTIIPRVFYDNAGNRKESVSVNKGSAANAAIAWAQQSHERTHTQIAEYYKTQIPIAEIVRTQEEYLDTNNLARPLNYLKEDFEKFLDCDFIVQDTLEAFEILKNEVTQTLNAQLEGLLAQNIEILSQIEERLTRLRNINAEKNAQIVEKETELTRLEKLKQEEARNLEELSATLAQAQQRIQELESQLEACTQEDLDALREEADQKTQEIEAKSAQLQALKAQKEALQEQIQTLQTQLQEQITKETTLQEQITKEQSTKAQLEAQLQNDTRDLEEAQRELSAELKELEQKIQELQAQKDAILGNDNLAQMQKKLEELKAWHNNFKANTTNTGNIKSMILNAHLSLQNRIFTQTRTKRLQAEVQRLNAKSKKLLSAQHCLEILNAKSLVDLHQAGLNVALHSESLRQEFVRNQILEEKLKNIQKEAQELAKEEAKATQQTQTKLAQIATEQIALESKIQSLSTQKAQNLQEVARINKKAHKTRVRVFGKDLRYLFSLIATLQAQLNLEVFRGLELIANARARAIPQLNALREKLEEEVTQLKVRLLELLNKKATILKEITMLFNLQEELNQRIQEETRELEHLSAIHTTAQKEHDEASAEFLELYLQCEEKRTKLESLLEELTFVRKQIKEAERQKLLLHDQIYQVRGKICLLEGRLGLIHQEMLQVA